MDIQDITQGFRQLAEISEEIRQTQTKLESLRAGRADIILYLRNDCEQTWVTIADTAELDYKRTIDIARNRELYLARNPQLPKLEMVVLSESDLEDMRRKLEESNGD